MNYLNGKVALVTGSSKGIEAEIVRQLADAEAAVIVNYPSDKSVADKVLKAITGEGGGPVAAQPALVHFQRSTGFHEGTLPCLLAFLVSSPGAPTPQRIVTV